MMHAISLRNASGSKDVIPGQMSLDDLLGQDNESRDDGHDELTETN